MTRASNRGRNSDPHGTSTNLIQEIQVAWQLLRDGRVPSYAKILPAILVAVYVLSPIDFIPDPLLGPGQVDDVAILFLGLALFRALVPEHIVREYYAKVQGKTPSDTEKPRSTAADDDYVDAEYRVLHDD